MSSATENNKGRNLKLILAAKELMIAAINATTHQTRDQSMSIQQYLPLARCASLRGYSQLVSEQGGDPQSLLKESGLGLVPIEQENLMIPSHCLYNALELASDQLNLPDFGLRLSQYQNLDVLGVFALMIKNADSLPELLQLAKQNFHKLHNHGAHINFTLTGGDLLMNYEQSVPQALGIQQSTYLAFGFIARMAQNIIQPNIMAKAIYFKSEAPADTSLFEEIFNAPVYFNQQFDGALINQDALSKHYKIDNVKIPGIENLCLTTTEQRDHPISLSQQVGLLISEQLSYGNFSLEYYAKQLKLSDRSLQRKLSEEGSSFKKILDQVRKDLASQYIQQRALSLAEITAALCFSEQAVFTRAFRRWFNTTPAQYRKTNHL